MGSALIGFDLWFQAEAHGAKDELQLRRANSNDAIGFVALAKEQLALVTEDGLHSVHG